MIDFDYNNNIYLIENNGITLTVEPDEYGLKPRNIEETKTVLLLWGHDKFIGDENPYTSINEANMIVNSGEIFKKLTVYLDRNDNLTCESRFGDGKRLLGFIFITKEKATELYDDLDENAEYLCEEKLKNEVADYNRYIKEKAYCYTVTDEDEDILDGGGSYEAKENIVETIKAMTEHCDKDYEYLFEMLIDDMVNQSQEQM